MGLLAPYTFFVPRVGLNLCLTNLIHICRHITLYFYPDLMYQKQSRYLSSKAAMPANLALCLVPHSLSNSPLIHRFLDPPFFFALSPLSCRFYLLLEFRLVTVGVEVIIQKSRSEQFSWNRNSDLGWFLGRLVIHFFFLLHKMRVKNFIS